MFQEALMTGFSRMKPLRFSGCLSLLLVVLLAFPLFTAEAQEVKKFKDWQIRCIPQGQEINPQTPPCVAEYVHVDENAQKPVLLIRAHLGGPEKIPVAVIVVPLLVRIPPGLTLRIGGKELITLPYQICTPSGCLAQFRFNSDLLSAFQKGSEGEVIVQLATGKDRATTFSLLGFTKALDSLK